MPPLPPEVVQPEGIPNEDFLPPPPGSIGTVDLADQARFENMLGAVDRVDGPSETDMPHYQIVRGASPAGATLGDSILTSLQSLKHHDEAVRTEMISTLGKAELKSGDMIKVQFQLMSLNLELQTTSNMAHHGVEDIKTVMRGQ